MPTGALIKGRAAKERLDSLQDQLSGARGSLTSASTAYDRASNPSGVTSTDPDPAQVRSALRNQQAAQSRVSGLESSVGDAQAELDLAKRLARDAKSLRDDAEDRTASRIDDAKDAAIPPNSFWEDFKSAVSKVWDVIVVIAKITVVVLGVVALIIGGPIAWVVFAAALVLLADALMKYANGEGTLGDVAWALVGCIPGTKGLTTLTALKNAFRAGGMLSAGAHVLGAGRTAIVQMAAGLRNAPAMLRSMPNDLRIAANAISRARQEGLAALPMLERATSRLALVSTPDGLTMMQMVRGTEQYQSLAGQARVTAAALRDAAETYGTVRTAQLVQHADGSYDVVFRYKGSWDDFQRSSADAKADFLTDAPDTRFSTTGPGERDPNLTRTWGRDNPVDSADPDLIMGGEFRPGYAYQVDHGVDLQLSGLDDAENFRWLEQSVNGSEGAQLNSLATRHNVPHGAVFNTFQFADRGMGLSSVARSSVLVSTNATP